MDKELPITIYSAAQVRELDRHAIEEHGIPGYTLMCRAGEAAFRALRHRWPRARRLLVLCGAGNNAGDGYVIARMARAEGLLVMVVALVDPDKLSGDASVAWETYRNAGGTTEEYDPAMFHGVDVVVDAILGTGLARELSGKPRELVEAVNASGIDVFAIDIPTGLNADTGQVMGAAILADTTMTFVGLKLGLYIGEGFNYTGHIVFDDLGLPAQLFDAMPGVARRMSPALVTAALPPRMPTAHKGEYGNVLIVGGDTGMVGAVRLAGEAALRSGAGRVTVATRPGHVGSVVGACPELMCHGIESASELSSLIDKCDIIAIGPGLGTGKWGKRMLETALDAGRPLIVDADALNLIANKPQRRDDWILTPHPGEAGRLLGVSAAQIQSNRSSAMHSLVETYGGTIVLKGAGSQVGRKGETVWVCDRGNPGMASPGMGDVLTGVIAGIASQCGDLFDAARAGVFVHAAAGDDAAKHALRGMLASDLIAHLGKWVNLQ